MSAVELNHKKYKILFKIAGITCVIWICYTYDVSKIFNIIIAFDFHVIVAVFIATVVLIFLKFLRWHILLVNNGCKVAIFENYMIYNKGLFWGLISPGKIGEFTKCISLKKKCGYSFYNSAIVVFIDRLYDLFVLMLCFIICLLLLFNSYINVLIVCLFILIAFFVALTLMLKVDCKISILGLNDSMKHNKLLIKVNQIIKINSGKNYVLPLVITLATIATMTYQGQNIALQVFGYQFGIKEIVLLICILSLSNVIPLSVMGLGSNEMIMLFVVKMLMPLHYYPEKVIAFSFSLTMLAFIPAIIYSAVVVALKKIIKYNQEKK